MLTIRPYQTADETAVSVLLVHAFDQNNELRLVETLRREGQVACELVAEQAGKVVGYICFSALIAPQGWWSLAPLGVSADLQGQGIGGELIRHGLDRARHAEAEAVVVVGNPRYYRRFGFVFDGPAQLESVYPAQYTGLFPIAPKAAAAAASLQYAPAFSKV